MAEASSLSAPVGLTREETGYGDHYIGSAEDLIAAGLITADQLPGQVGRGKTMCTFYAGVQVGKGSNRPNDEHHLQIKRVRGGKLEVIKGVPEQVRGERCAAWRAKDDAERAAQKAARYEQEKREAASKKTPESFRNDCLTTLGMLKWFVDGAKGQSPFKFSPSDRAEIEAVLRQLDALIQRGEVLPLRPPSAGRAHHLTLAWSSAAAAQQGGHHG